MATTDNKNNNIINDQALVSLAKVISFINSHKDQIISANKNLKNIIDGLNDTIHSKNLQQLINILKNDFNRSYEVELTNLKQLIKGIYNFTLEFDTDAVNKAVSKLEAMDLVVAALGNLSSRLRGLHVNEAVAKNYVTMATIIPMIRSIITVLEALRPISIRAILWAHIKLLRLRSFIRRVLNTTNRLAKIILKSNKNEPIIIIKAVLLRIFILRNIYDNIQILIKQVKNIEGIGLFMRLKLWRLRKIVSYLIKTVHKIYKTLTRRKNRITLRSYTLIIAHLIQLQFVLSVFKNLIQVIHSIKLGKFNRFKLMRIRWIIGSLIKLTKSLRKLARQNRNPKTLLRLLILFKCLQIIFKSLRKTLISIMIVAAVGILFLILAPIIILVLWILFAVIKLIVIIAKHIVRSPRILLGILMLIAVLWLLKFLATSIIALALIAMVSIFALPIVILFLLAIVALMLVFVLFAMLANLIVPYLTAIGAAILAVTVTVLSILLIALMLTILQNIKLDIALIKENAKKVLNTAAQIIIWVGEPLDNESSLAEDAGSEKPTPGILGILGNGLIKFIEALYGASILIPTLIAVACILLITAILRLVQNLDLDPTRIRDNIKMVFDVANWIIEFITEPQEDRFTDSDKDDAIISLCGFVYKPLLKLIDAITGAATLVVMVFAVLSILLIATMLRLLQNLDLDEGKIMNNVQMVMTICNHIIGGIFAPDNEDDSKSDRGILGTLIAWVYKPLVNILDAIFAMAYLAVMTIAIICLWGIAKLLQVIQDLDLNETQILNNVDKVLRITQHIIDIIFNPDEEDDEKSSRGILGSLIAWIYKPFAKILDAIFAMAYLAIMIIAVLCLLGIAKLLQMIQELELDENKIMANVETVLRVCHVIIEMIFNPDEENDEKSSRGILGLLISLIYPPLGKVLDAIFAMAYLAVISIAIICVLAIAKLLTLIGEIDTAVLETAQENAKLTMNTALMISNLIYKEDDQSQSQSSRGGIAAFISWVDPSLGQIFQAILTIAYLALMIIAMTIVLGIVKMMERIGKIDRSIIENAVGNVELVIGAGHNIVNRVYEGSDNGSQESNRGVLLKIVEWVHGKDVADILSAMLTIAHLAMMFFAIYIVAGIAKSLNEVGKIDRDKIFKARDNVDLVMSTTQYVMERLMSGDYELPEGNDDNLSILLNWLLPKELKSIINAIMTIAALAFAEVMIGALGEIANGLSKVANIDTSAIAIAKQKTNEIVDAAGSILKQMKISITGQFNDDEFEQTAKIIKELSGLIGAVTSISDSLIKLAKQEEIDIDDTVKKTIKIYQGCLAIIEAIAQPPEIEGKKAAWVEVLGSLGSGLSVITTHWMIFEQYEAYTKRLKALGNVVKEAATTIKNLTGLMTEIPKLTRVMQEVVTSSSNTPIERATGIVSRIWKSINMMFLIIYNSARDDDETWLSESNYDQISDILSGMNGLIKQMNTVIKNLTGLMTEIPKLTRVMQEVVTSSSNTPIERATGIVSRIWKSINMMFLIIYNSARDDDETWLSENNYKQVSNILNGMNGLIKQMIGTIVLLTNMFKNIKTLATWFPSLSNIEIPSNLESNILNLFKLTRNIIIGAVGADSSAGWSTLSIKATAAILTTKLMSNLIQAYNGMIPYIQMLINNLSRLNINSDVINANTIKIKDALYNMFSIIKSASRPTNPEAVRQNMDLIDRINQSITNFTHVTTQDVKNSKDLTDNYIAFLTKVNSMDFTKLKTTEQLMKHWADMSRTINGNFQGLAQAINEHIMPTLKSLNKTMDESMKVQKQIIDDLSKPIDASRMVGDTPGMTPIGSPSDSNQTGAPTNTGSPDGGGYSGYNPSSSSYPTTSSQSGIDITPDEESSYETNNFGYDDKKEPIGDGPSFINPYVRNTDKQRKSALERLTKALDGDALRVKIIN